MKASTASAAVLRYSAIAYSATVLVASGQVFGKTVSSEHDAEKLRLSAPALHEGIEDIVRRHYPEGLPYSEIRRFGSEALPPLRAMLSDVAEKDFLSNIVGAIGIIGGPGASDTLINFIEASRDRPLDPDAYRAALTAVVALGYVANGGDTRAMRFIAAAAQSASQPAPHANSLRLSPSAIGVQATLALGLSGQPEARGVLEEILRTGDDAMRERAAESLRTLEQVSKLGLHGYFKLRRN